MKKIIAISGKGNSGKTTSIKMAFEKFMIQDKVKCLNKFDLKLPNNIQEIKISKDREIACICMWYSDCNIYSGI